MFPAYGFGGGQFGVCASSERDTPWLDAAASLVRDFHHCFHLLLDEPAALGVRGVVEEARARAEADTEIERGLVLVEAAGGLVPDLSCRARCRTVTEDFDDRRRLFQAGDACAATEVGVEAVIEFGHPGLETRSPTE